jgi:hypothetical protein
MRIFPQNSTSPKIQGVYRAPSGQTLISRCPHPFQASGIHGYVLSSHSGVRSQRPRYLARNGHREGGNLAESRDKRRSWGRLPRREALAMGHGMEVPTVTNIVWNQELRAPAQRTSWSVSFGWPLV